MLLSTSDGDNLKALYSSFVPPKKIILQGNNNEYKGSSIPKPAFINPTSLNKTAEEVVEPKQESLSKTELNLKIELLLLEGKKNEALAIAVDNREWGLAMLISCICGPDKYQEVVKLYAGYNLPPSSPLYLTTMIYSNQAASCILADAEGNNNTLLFIFKP